MPQDPREDDDYPEKRHARRRKLSDRQVDAEFARMAEEFTPEPLTGPRDYAPAPEDETFVPPDPGPVTSSDPFLNLGWILLAGGLLLILASLIFWPSAPRSFHLGCISSALIGGALLVWRMPREKDDEDNFGAIV